MSTGDERADAMLAETDRLLDRATEKGNPNLEGLALVARSLVSLTAFAEALKRQLAALEERVAALEKRR